MRIAVTGCRGQLARSLAEQGAQHGHAVIAVARPELDLANPDPDAIHAALAAAKPDVIVNAAAYTAVDKAESERELAFAVNADGAGAVARAAARIGVPVVHVSTDYVFAGDKAEPYSENDPTGPTGVYGASKLAGETAVLSRGADAAILRTAWVYSPFGANFVKTMLRLADTRDEIGVVGDQRGNPTSALDLADAVVRVAQNLVGGDAPEHRGIFHATGSGEGSWADLAEIVFAVSRATSGPTARVKRIATTEYVTAAARPANSRLECGKLFERHGVRFPEWRSSVENVTARLLQEGTWKA